METEYFNKVLTNLRSSAHKIRLSNELLRRIDIGEITKTELAKSLDISRVTLDTRLLKSNWKKGEMALFKEIE